MLRHNQTPFVSIMDGLFCQIENRFDKINHPRTHAQSQIKYDAIKAYESAFCGLDLIMMQYVRSYYREIESSGLV